MVENCINIFRIGTVAQIITKATPSSLEIYGENDLNEKRIIGRDRRPKASFNTLLKCVIGDSGRFYI